jgi:hypothetical protein
MNSLFSARFRLRSWPKVFLLPAILVCAFSDNFGLWAMMNVEVPVARILSNVSQYIRENPQDAQGYYVLGRIHSLAFAHETDTLEIQQGDKEKLPGFIPWQSIIVKRNQPGPLSEKARHHLVESVKNYRRATELAPDQPMSFLGLGWMLESGAQFAGQLEALPGEVKAGKSADPWKEGALKAYRKAYALTIKGDLGRIGLGPGADAAISLEAGLGIARILQARKRTNEEEGELRRVLQSVKTLEGKPRAVTPIIFPLDGPASLDELLAQNKIVRFDLAGDGQAGWWPWVKPGTGILVWDPKHSGRVDSGLQLFGSVTWWMSWRDGYQPLAVLDDNQDGQLEGKELDGLAVWQDRNTNGISEPGEVRTIQAAGIDRIAVTATAKTDGVPCNPLGLRLSNGAELPSYDWTPTEVKYPAVAVARPISQN